MLVLEIQKEKMRETESQHLNSEVDSDNSLQGYEREKPGDTINIVTLG